MKRRIRTFLNKLPYIKNLAEQVKKQGEFPAGHYYSPIPDRDEVLEYIQSRKPPEKEIPGLELDGENQLRLLEEYREFYEELPFPEKPEAGNRYYYENKLFPLDNYALMFYN